ncbi:hypothetical protein [Sanguibacter sp. 25GB23B1]|uniref:hypothetical protein n=1 Tax=unclassified Sanguibacter TaxID=2645534 RepID=UPI0032AECCA2
MDPSSSDFLEGVDAADLGEEFCILMNYVLRKKYESIAVYEITGLTDDEDPIPFFSVKVEGSNYDSLGMGRGELAALTLAWRLSRLERGSIVLLEEPESHLAVYSHDALVYALMKLVIDNDLTVVCASHTPGFFRHLPEQSVIVIASSPAPRIMSSLSSDQIARQLGATFAPSLQLVTEDECAAMLLGEILELVDSELRRRVNINYSLDGESGVRAATERSRPVGGGPAILGVLDGDQRHKAMNPHHTFLPGHASPEVVLQAAVGRWRSGQVTWIPPFPAGADHLRAVLARLDGVDHHDWIDSLAAEYGGKSHVVRALAPLIVSWPSDRENVDEMVKTIRSRLPLGD